MTPEDISNLTDFTDMQPAPAQRIKVIGVGGGGNNAVNHMFNQGIKDVSFVLINTDRQVLDQSAVPTRLVIGPGRGAGGKPERARDYAEQNAEQIAQLFNDKTDMVFITAGMGGGTGTGAGPVVARIAREMGILTVGIVTIPFLFEGRRKVIKAIEGAQEMGRNVDALLIINNQRLTEIYKDLDIFNAFARADDTLLTAAQGITEIITLTGKINRDFNDVDSTLRDGGTAIISTGYGEGDQRVSKAIDDALHSPLLRNNDVLTSKRMLMVLYVDEDTKAHPFNTDELIELNNFIGTIDENIDVLWGLYPVPNLGDKVKITILASGFDATLDSDSATAETLPPAVNPEDKERIDSIIAKDYGNKGLDVLSNSGSKSKVLSPEELDSDEAMAVIEQPTVQRIRRMTGTASGSRFTRQTPKSSAPQNPDDSKSQSSGASFDFSDVDS